MRCTPPHSHGGMSELLEHRHAPSPELCLNLALQLSRLIVDGQVLLHRRLEYGPLIILGMIDLLQLAQSQQPAK